MISLSFNLMPFFCSRQCITFSCYVSLVSSQLWWLLRLSLFFMTLTVLRSTGQVYYKMALYWDLSDVLSWLDWGYGVWGGWSERWKRTTYNQYFKTAEVDFDHLVEVAFVWFLQCSSSSPTFPHCPLWKEVIMCSPNLKNGKYFSPREFLRIKLIF